MEDSAEEKKKNQPAAPDPAEENKKPSQKPEKQKSDKEKKNDCSRPEAEPEEVLKEKTAPQEKTQTADQEKKPCPEKENQGDPPKSGTPGKKRVIAGRLMMVLGMLLLACAVLLYAMNYRESLEAGETAAEMLPEVQEAIVEKVRQEETQPSTEPEHVNPYNNQQVEESNEMTVWVHNSWSYIGYLLIPKLELELPVLSELSQYNLGMAPCRHLGSTKSDDLVLAAHNYSFHFGRIRELAPGDEVSFIDMDGVLSTYQVVTVAVIKPTDIDLVTDPSLDLTLYTCTYGGQNRVMVGCQRTGAVG